MTFADWKLDLDSELNPEVSIDDAYDLVMKSVEPLGQEYCQEVARYKEERWVDFAANEGKDSGGYAADPYRVHPYVLMSWTGRLSDVYTLIHEIGAFWSIHLSDNHQAILMPTCRPTMLKRRQLSMNCFSVITWSTNPTTLVKNASLWLIA